MAPRRRLPPVEQIEAFLHAARSPNFRTAAEELALSPPALTRRIQAFSGYVGHALFERSAAGMRLTDVGKQCLDELEPMFLGLREATASVGVRAEDQVAVKISVSHSLAVSWLIPRLHNFRSKHPNIDLSIKVERTASDVRSGAVDLGICHVGVDTAQMQIQPLLDVAVTPVASPTLAAAYLAGQVQLEDQHLLASAQSAHQWTWWAQATGFPQQLGHGVEFDVLHGMYEAAAHGLGIALGASPTVCPHLESGRLTALGLGVARLEHAYRLVGTRSCLRRPQVAKVWRWLQSEAHLAQDPFGAAVTTAREATALPTRVVPLKSKAATPRDARMSL